ncbi:unnamed protein product [Zymoseptoria tritici ST99CH_1A5]|uniref:Secreted protein n=1 Tax=Zymoseptoria tritici ST99CH_1A5 TaxID=1276529 RepID=A0A1Y6L2J2_ZYMTR|nr:unnamed protein product [Zymoseptoria tritici ST99CH_1A5]
MQILNLSILLCLASSATAYWCIPCDPAQTLKGPGNCNDYPNGNCSPQESDPDGGVYGCSNKCPKALTACFPDFSVKDQSAADCDGNPNN